MSKLMISVSGIRGIVGESLNSEDVLEFAKAFGEYSNKGKVAVGRDTRVTGDMIKSAVISGLLAVGCEVIDLGIVPTPTLLLYVKERKLDGGLVITASHNPAEWNALKLVSSRGRFLTKEEGQKFLSIYSEKRYLPVKWDKFQKLIIDDKAIDLHIEKIKSLESIDCEKIKKKGFKVVIDSVNGAGSIASPRLLENLGCDVVKLFCEPNGIFPRNAEPRDEYLTDLKNAVVKNKADIGFATDPDVDRLVIVDEEGNAISEENTIAIIADYLLSKTKGNVVTNLSTSMRIDFVTKKHGCEIFKSPVGEANVVQKMEEVNAIFGGEGNGGVIFPKLNYTRDSLVGMALILQYLADSGKKISEIWKKIPQYNIYKDKIENYELNSEKINYLVNEFKPDELDTQDGYKFVWKEKWVHIRPSGTEPIVRIFSEALSIEEAKEIALKIKEKLLN